MLTQNSGNVGENVQYIIKNTCCLLLLNKIYIYNYVVKKKS